MPPETFPGAGVVAAPPEALGQTARWKHVFLLVLIAAATLAPGLGSNVVTLNAEQRVWQVTQTMLRTGDYMVPHLEGKPHFTKPPLVYWMGVATGILLGRDDVLVSRLPSLLCAVASVVLTYLLGCFMRSRQTGFLAGLVLLSSQFFAERARLATFDIPLTAAVLLALVGAWHWIVSSSKAGLVALFAGGVLAFCVKGPIGWLIIAIGIVGGLAVRKELKRLVTWRALAFVAATVVCSLPWYVHVVATQPEARVTFATELTLPFGKVSEHATARHYAPFYAYLAGLPVNILPWTLYLPVVGLCARRQRGGVSRQSPLWFLLIWIAAPFLFFSVVPAKQDAYLLPLYPAIALTIAWFLVSAFAGQEAGVAAWLRRTNLAVGALLFPAAVALGFLFWLRAGASIGLSVGVGIVCVLAGAAVFWLARIRENKAAVFAFLAGWLVILAALYAFFMPTHRCIHEDKKSPEALAYAKRVEHLRSLWKSPEGKQP